MDYHMAVDELLVRRDLRDCQAARSAEEAILEGMEVALQI